MLKYTCPLCHRVQDKYNKNYTVIKSVYCVAQLGSTEESAYYEDNGDETGEFINITCNSCNHILSENENYDFKDIMTIKGI